MPPLPPAEGYMGGADGAIPGAGAGIGYMDVGAGMGYMDVGAGMG